MEKFLREFEEFCESPSVNSGKARSYAKAICYLCEYMDIDEINVDTVNKIKMVENSIQDKNSIFYQDLLVFLKVRGQKSYLEKGFIRAALKYLFLYNEK